MVPRCCVVAAVSRTLTALDPAGALVAGRGRIVAAFFDVGQSRSLAWARRPQAAVLVAALADPERGWDAIVIGEYERAFYGGQYTSMAPLFEHYGVQLWMPEVGGRVDYHAEDHEETMLVSEADFVAAQDASAPRGPAGTATRRYLLAGLLACGVCGRRLESAWSNGKHAYRCRHGYTSAVTPDPARPKNLYVREDTIMPRLAALAILQQGNGLRGSKQSRSQLSPPAQAADQIEQFRATGVTLIYDPATKTLRTDGANAIPSLSADTQHNGQEDKGGTPPGTAPATARAGPG